MPNEHVDAVQAGHREVDREEHARVLGRRAHRLELVLLVRRQLRGRLEDRRLAELAACCSASRGCRARLRRPSAASLHLASIVVSSPRSSWSPYSTRMPTCGRAAVPLRARGWRRSGRRRRPADTTGFQHGNFSVSSFLPLVGLAEPLPRGSTRAALGDLATARSRSTSPCRRRRALRALDLEDLAVGLDALARAAS